jgi:DNA polymerase I-like protein with 3'-5' exonuclease and polymerase domains
MKTAGHSFNLASPKQLGEVLFDTAKKLAEPNKRKTKRDNMPQVKKC